LGALSQGPSALFIIEFNATRNVLRLVEGDFTQDVVSTRDRLFDAIGRLVRALAEELDPLLEQLASSTEGSRQ